MADNTFSTWALVELFGHTKLAGLVTEQKFGTNSMLHINVPQVGNIPAWTKIVGVSAIYAINPMTEKDAREQAAMIQAVPIDKWDMQRIFENRIEDLVKVGQLRRPPEAEMDSDDDVEFG